ncbi:MAG: hypothetical protein IT365_00580 [Candidatus Hydrogenedentes bacterium]|nr:hypothetical protein [Candidatus Hydrogenedentota bacterium]
MGARLSPETEAALRKLAREIGNSRGLDDDAQEELYGHLEDKTLGYLSGEDGITEADAVLLTREHFGDPGAFPEALAQMPTPFRSSVSLPRRLAAVAVLTLAVGVAFSVVRLLIALCLDRESAVVFFGPAGRPWMFVLEAISLGVIFLRLQRWRTLERRGSRVWYQNCPGSIFAFCVVALIFLDWCVPGVRLDQVAAAAGLEQFLYSLRRPPHPIIYSYYFLIAVDWAPNLIAPMLWIWWGEQRQYRTKATMLSAVAWAGFNTTMMVPMAVFGNPVYLLGPTDSRYTMYVAMGRFAIQSTWGLAPERPLVTVVAWGYMAFVLALFAGTAAVMYLLPSWTMSVLGRIRRTEIRLRPVAR